MKYILYSLFTLLILGTVSTPISYAGGLSNSALGQIQSLMDQYNSLQNELNQVKGNTASGISNPNYQQTTTGLTTRELQQLLATDPTIYPSGLVTGYYGPLTIEAVKRFQERNGLAVTGTLTADTKALFEAYLKETQGGQMTPGLLQSPDTEQNVEERLCNNPLEKDKYSALCKQLLAKKSNPVTNTERCVGTNTKCIGGSPAQQSSTDTDAIKTIDDAQSAIEASITALHGAYANGEFNNAQSVLNDAEEYLTGARNAYYNQDYAHAITLANQAKTHAGEAKVLVTTNKTAVTPVNSASNAIKGTQIVIQEIASEIERIGGSESTQAERILNEAIKKIDSAEKSYQKKDYTSASSDAQKANTLANEALQLIAKDDLGISISFRKTPATTVTQTIISFTWNNKDYTTEVNSTKSADVLKQVGAEIDTPVSQLDRELKYQVSTALSEATSEKKLVESAIKSAGNMIDTTGKQLDGASNGNKASVAEKLLTEARTKLDQSKGALTDNMFESAKNLADQAKNLAKEAKNAL